MLTMGEKFYKNWVLSYFINLIIVKMVVGLILFEVKDLPIEDGTEELDNILQKFLASRIKLFKEGVCVVIWMNQH